MDNGNDKWSHDYFNDLSDMLENGKKHLIICVDSKPLTLQLLRGYAKTGGLEAISGNPTNHFVMFFASRERHFLRI